MINWDPTKVKEESFQLLPDGEYDVSIIDVELRETQKGYPMAAVKAQVINNQEFNGKWLFHNVTFMPEDAKGAGMAKHFLKSIGQPIDKPGVNIDDWKGCTFRAKVGTRTYEGKTYNEIKGVDQTELGAAKEKNDVPF
jgi:hypothetical protein